MLWTNQIKGKSFSTFMVVFLGNFPSAGVLEHTGTQFWQIHWPYYVVAVLHVLQDGQVFGVVCKQVILLFATLLKALFMVQWLCGLGLEKIIATVLLLLAVYTWCGTTTTSLLYYVSCKTIKFPAAAANNLRGSKTGPLLSSSSIVDRCVCGIRL